MRILPRLLRAALLGGLVALPIVRPLHAQPPATPAAGVSAADADWEAFRALPTRPAKGTPESEVEAWVQKHIYGDYAAAALAFYRNHPTDPRRWDAANSYAATILNFSSRATGEELTRARAMIAGILAASDADPKVQERAAFKLLTFELSAESNPDIEKANLADVKAKVDGFVSRFPQAMNLTFAEHMYVQLLMKRDPAAAESRLQEDLKHANPKIVEMAKGKLAVLEITRAPIDLRFTAVDGREVDFSKLRGKVVLIDFWATWCVPCVAELPNVKRVFEAYRDKGFEVVGISLDSANSREKLLSFVKERDMPWPQYFDGGGWDTKLSRKYDIRSIPAMFLLDRRGVLASTDARGPQLEEQVKKLLAE